MSHTKVEAARGVKWIGEGAQLALKNPAAFAVMGLIIGVIGIIPILGGLALLVLAPALYGGIVYAAREQQQGRKAEIGHLFQAFQTEGRLPQMVLLCLPLIGGYIVAGIIAAILLGGALLSAGVASAADSEGMLRALMGAGSVVLLFALVLVIAIMLLVWALIFFAIPKLILQGGEAFAAMKLSFAAAKANIGAYLIFVVLVAVAYGVVAWLFAQISPWFAGLAASVVVLPVACCGMYLAWRDVFGAGETVELPVMGTSPEPAPPPSEPPAE
ncbi:MAG TPA: BPSS1780 family membrane protein [Xanthomonadaceae bacterium]|nr:BPSS1780 family membrane protein [Xanthomonadaceae bacterium]